MSDKSSSSSSSGIGFAGVLTCVFVAAKLWGVIDWSWWWVASPLWIPLCIVALLGFVAFAVVSLMPSKKHGKNATGAWRG